MYKNVIYNNNYVKRKAQRYIRAEFSIQQKLSLQKNDVRHPTLIKISSIWIKY